MQQLKAINSDAQILKIFSTDEEEDMCMSKYGPVPCGSPLSYQQRLTESVDDIVLNHPDQLFPL